MTEGPGLVLKLSGGHPQILDAANISLPHGSLHRQFTIGMPTSCKPITESLSLSHLARTYITKPNQINDIS